VAPLGVAPLGAILGAIARSIVAGFGLTEE
jgi:hypothetical protein